MKIGIGGGIGPIRGGISNKGAGVGLGPLSVGGSFSGGGSLLGFLFTLAAILLVIFWPMALVLQLSGQSDQAEVSTWVKVLAWLAEGVYALVVAWWWFYRFAHPKTIWRSWVASAPVEPKANPEELAEAYLDIADFYKQYLEAWKNTAYEPGDEAQYLDLNDIGLWALRRGGDELSHLDTGNLQVWGDSVRFEGYEREVRLDMDKVEDVFQEDELVAVQMRGRKTFEAFGGLDTYLPLIEASVLWAYGGDDRATAKKLMKQAISDFKSKADEVMPRAAAPMRGSGVPASTGARCSHGHPMDPRDSKCGQCGARLKIQWMEH